MSILEHVFFHVHGIYVMKFLNCVCVFYVKTETTIQYDHNKLQLKQFNKKIETTIQYDHNKLKQVNMVMKKNETTKKKDINLIKHLESSCT